MEMKSKTYISKRGLMRGAIAALIGSMIFTLVDTAVLITTLAIHKELHLPADLNDHFVIAGVLLAFGFALSVLPGTYGGKWLARHLYREAQIGHLIKKRAMVKGTLLGILAGFCICVFAVTFFYYRGDFRVLIYRIVSAIIIAGCMGGWAGAKLADDIAAYRPSN
jgi:MFS family permease